MSVGRAGGGGGRTRDAQCSTDLPVPGWPTHSGSM